MLGVVQFDNDVRVLLKRSSTGESRYFARGENAFGFTVEEITDSAVRLSRDGKSERIAMSNAVPIEGTNGSTLAAAAPGGGFSPGGGRFFSDRRRGERDRGGDGGGPGGGERGFSTAQLFSLPTWADRLKRLEEIKDLLGPERYERLKRFMTERARQEQERR